MAVPVATPVITPVEELIVAISVDELVQVPPKTVDVKVIEFPMFTSCVPERVPALGGAETVTVRVADCPETV